MLHMVLRCTWCWWYWDAHVDGGIGMHIIVFLFFFDLGEGLASTSVVTSVWNHPKESCMNTYSIDSIYIVWNNWWLLIFFLSLHFLAWTCSFLQYTERNKESSCLDNLKDPIIGGL